jgi:glycerate-2-kinase
MIKNTSTLLSHGHKDARQKAIDIVTHALRACDPLKATHRFLSVEGKLLTVGDRVFDLDRFDNIYAIGAGKATYRQAVALEEILGDRITDGLMVVKDGQKGPLNKIRITEAAHPVPDKRSFEACRDIMALAEKAGPDDMVFCLMSGGISSLCIQPVEGISLKDKIEVNRLMVHSGADVTEIMSVRRHLSRIKGGRLAEVIHPATIMALTVSDAIGDPIEWNTDWTSPDSSTFQDAVRILKKYQVWELCPASVKTYFEVYEDRKETPKTLSGCNIHTQMTVRIKDLWEAAMKRASQLGLKPHLLTTTLCGESREVGRALAAIATECADSGNPFKPPCALIASGESSVRVMGANSGTGGANQELAAGAALNLEDRHPIAVFAVDTDGTDGPTQLAGALTDGSTAARAKAIGYDIYHVLLDHNITPLLKQIGDAVETGSTGTNVNDLVVIVVLDGAADSR